MKKKVAVLLLATVMAVSVSACGKEPATKAEVLQETTSETSQEPSIEEVKEVVEEPINKEPELPNWKGIEDYYGYNLNGGGFVGMDLCFPSMVPSTPGRMAYQWDPALVIVTGPGNDSELNNLKADSLAGNLELTKGQIIDEMDAFRDSKYDNFDFVIETEEPTNINGLDMYKHTGKHTYTLDGEAQEIPFVAYSVDTKQAEGCYVAIVVMDDSVNNTSMEPLPEGTIEAYAKKMAESIVVKTSLF